MDRISWPLVLRISSISIGIYEYILTLSAEWNFYFGPKRRGPRWEQGTALHKNLEILTRIPALSVGATLFCLLRYVSIMAIGFNNVGYFLGGFSTRECEVYHLVSPTLKVIQVMISQTIIGLRTYGIAGRNRTLKYFLPAFWIVCTISEWSTDLHRRGFLQNQHMNCIATSDPDRLYTWSFYLITMVYDLVTFCISCYYLLHGLPLGVFKASKFLRLLVVDGMQYFVALTAVNVLNLVVYRSKDAWMQSSAAPFGYLITWVMSQRILIHMRDGGNAGVHWFSATSPDLAFSDAAFVPGAPDRNRRDETTQGSEEVTLRSEGTADFGKLFPDVGPTSPPPSVGWQPGRLHHCVRYPPGPPSPSDFGPQAV